MARAVAICKGGPLDEQCFSVLLDEQGSPPPLTGRAELVGSLYVPGATVELTTELQQLFQSEMAEGLDHEAAFEYVPVPFTVVTSEDGDVSIVEEPAA